MQHKFINGPVSLLVTYFLFFAIFKSDAEPSGSPDSRHAIEIAGRCFLTPFQTEAEHIVFSVVSDISEEIYYAKYHSVPGANSISVQVTAGDLSSVPVFAVRVWNGENLILNTNLQIAAAIWAPENYVSLTKALAERFGIKPGFSATNESIALLADLLDAKASTIQSKNESLSKALAVDFLNPHLHEESALLLCAFALRDHSGNFFELSGPLCRITAHLSIAIYINDQRQSGTAGQIAEASLFTLMHNQRQALGRIRRIAAQGATVERWKRVLEAYNTGDYRTLTNCVGRSPLERIALFDASSKSKNPNTAWENLTDQEKLTPDFVRITEEGSYSVETAQQLFRLSISLELKEVATIYELIHRERLQPSQLATFLNVMPTRCFEDGTVRVISRGQWAHFFQRHLCHAIQNDHYFLAHLLGDSAGTEEFTQKAAKTFSTLRLYPFVEHMNVSEMYAETNVDAQRMRIIRTTPQLVPGMCWRDIRHHLTAPMVQITNAHGAVSYLLTEPKIKEKLQWYRDCPLIGTSYDPLPHSDNTIVTNDDAWVECVNKMHEIAPFDLNISHEIFRYEFHEHPTYQQVEDLYRPMLSFSSDGMFYVAQSTTNQPEIYEKFMVGAASGNPSHYFGMGDYFSERGQKEKAAKYYEMGTEKDPDSVRGSYYSGWLMRYYLEKGETNKAERITNMAAETYSKAGLRTKVDFLNLVGRKTEASQWYEKIKERYGDN